MNEKVQPHTRKKRPQEAPYPLPALDRTEPFLSAVESQPMLNLASSGLSKLGRGAINLRPSQTSLQTTSRNGWSRSAAEQDRVRLSQLRPTNATPVNESPNQQPDYNLYEETGGANTSEVLSDLAFKTHAHVDNTTARLATTGSSVSSKRVSTAERDNTIPATRPPVASTLPEQLAACRSLAKMGLTNVTLGKIQRYSNATVRWVQSLEEFLNSDETHHIYRNGVPRINQIHKLAIFHNKPIRPPKRFVCSGKGKHVRRRVPMIYRDALSEYRMLADLLSQFHSWIDVEALPITEDTLELLDSILDDSSLNRLSPKRRKAIQWYERMMQPSSSLAIQLANGNLEKLRSAVDSAYRFANHVHFKRTLGQDFTGLDTPWQSLHATIEFSQSIHDVIGDPHTSAQIVDQWSTQGTHFYTLARQASTLSRRLNKLDKLTRRHEKLLHPHYSDDRLISTLPHNYLTQAQNAVLRLKLWIEVALAGRNIEHLTPANVLQSLKP